MSDNELRLAVIISSVRDGRYAPLVAGWFLDHAADSAFELDVIDLIDVDLPLNTPAHGGEASDRAKAALADVTPVLERADAFIVITPEYNHSYPAALKNLIDWHSTQWQAKPVGIVSYGGFSGGIRATEHLRHVFAELHAVTLRDAVSIPAAYAAFDEDGRMKEPEVQNTFAKALMVQLDWWARALRDARTARPFQLS
ncbi:NAD(P)H-dependent oxidoreductase [Actinocorallia longicatena]|uniref:NAD(P)H-dependent oxidoreductase n=1 Tax=Actinocorallia longicatena TaxID=111803 RepID=A0ABP6QD34_9ACTN